MPPVSSAVLLRDAVGGAMQVVATKIHSPAFNLPPHCLSALYLVADGPDLDNTLNMMSSLSLGGSHALHPLSAMWQLVKGMMLGERVFCLGGNSICGVLGQVRVSAGLVGWYGLVSSPRQALSGTVRHRQAQSGTVVAPGVG